MTSYSVYCDESCHLEHDGISTMVVGGVWCEDEVRHQIFEDLRAIKIRHGFKPYWELKWNAVSEVKLSYYADVIRYFYSRPQLHFRALIVPDKTKLNHSQFNQTHDTFYYKMYFDMLKNILQPQCQYNIYLDIKDTQGQKKIERLKEFLCGVNHYEFNARSVVRNIQLVRSHEVELVQLADFLIGAVCYANRGLNTSSAKLKLINLIRRLSGYSLTMSTLTREEKTNIFIWKGAGM
ncbi:MAG: DUF3800 domain-containing protein [Muribaculaceae bacterium]|nr:DUF3800 domain-containing protein [Muribaculaceae bacterium]